MDGVREAAVCICVCCILCGTVKMLVPSTSFDRMIKLAIAAFIVCSAAIPIQEAVKNIKLPSVSAAAVEESERMEEAVISFSGRVLERVVSGQIESSLQSENVEAENIRVYMDILQDGSISISQVEVTLSQKDYEKRAVLSQTVYSRTGVRANFITEEE